MVGFSKSPILKRKPHPPRKYDNLLARQRMLKMRSITKLVKQIDKDFTCRVSLEELQDFVHKKGLQHNIPDEVTKRMFYDAACCRQIYYEYNRNDPLTEVEIYAATRIKYVTDKNTGKPKAVPRKYRK